MTLKVIDVHTNVRCQHGGCRNQPSDLCHPRPVSTFLLLKKIYIYRLSKNPRKKRLKCFVFYVF